MATPLLLPAPTPILEELGRSSHRVAISTDRLVSREAGQGRFRRTEDAQGNRVRRLALAAAVFLRRFLLRVLPAGFVRIHPFRLLATRGRTAKFVRDRALRTVPAPAPLTPEPVAAPDSG